MVRDNPNYASKDSRFWARAEVHALGRDLDALEARQKGEAKKEPNLFAKVLAYFRR